MISDVHSNLPALEAVLESIEAVGPEEIWCLGDVVGYGAQPDECAAIVRERCAVSLNGNHDLAVTGAIDAATFSETARAAVDWTRGHASAETLEWLASLSPEGARDGFGLDAQTERICLIGHSHVSLFFTRPPSTGRKSYATGAQATDGDLLDLGEGEWLLNPGSVGQPRDGDPRAAWLEIDTDDRTARYHRVEYDAVAAGAAILEAGLPSALAERLQIGR